MLQNKGRPNRLGIWGWLGGGRWGFERYLYTLHRLTGLGLLAYFLLHIVVTSARAFGEQSWAASMARVAGPLFVVGEYLVFAAFAFHAANGIRLALIELGFAVGKPIEPVYPYRTSVDVQRPLAIVRDGGGRAGGGHRRARLLRARSALGWRPTAMREQRWWTWHLGAGLVILALLGLHMVIMHLDAIVGIFNPAGGQPIDWANVVARAQSAFFMVTYVVLLGAALFHGLYGFRNIVFELNPADGLKKVISAVLIARRPRPVRLRHLGCVGELPGDAAAALSDRTESWWNAAARVWPLIEGLTMTNANLSIGDHVPHPPVRPGGGHGAALGRLPASLSPGHDRARRPQGDQGEPRAVAGLAVVVPHGRLRVVRHAHQRHGRGSRATRRSRETGHAARDGGAPAQLQHHPGPRARPRADVRRPRARCSRTSSATTRRRCASRPASSGSRSRSWSSTSSSATASSAAAAWRRAPPTRPTRPTRVRCRSRRRTATTQTRATAASRRARPCWPRDAGPWKCHFAGECSRACPKGVDPARAIQLMKRDLVGDYLRLLRRRRPAPLVVTPVDIKRKEGIPAAPAPTVTRG